MEKIIEYSVVTGKLEELVAGVNERIANGLQPFGPLVARPSPEGVMYHQAMIKTAWDNTPPKFRAAMQR